eukprot:TRINITY_DN67601_c2_g1_i1.p2 TRINITY_DN67601_c2_g1~~TRINITY_DN67601_c2_g1_i1.p2  ORF type:complete len:174 (+),score=18.60 TRINITY_DN67601_c2_g1_i1:105-626(+)
MYAPSAGKTKKAYFTKGTFRKFALHPVVSSLNALLIHWYDMLEIPEERRLLFTAGLRLDPPDHYAKMSAGQQRRCDMCIAIALFELVSLMSTCKPQFLMLDDMADALDEHGRSNVLKAITKLLHQGKVRQVFFATHEDPAWIREGAQALGIPVQDVQVSHDSKGGTQYKQQQF